MPHKKQHTHVYTMDGKVRSRMILKIKRGKKQPVYNSENLTMFTSHQVSGELLLNVQIYKIISSTISPKRVKSVHQIAPNTSSFFKKF